MSQSTQAEEASGQQPHTKHPARHGWAEGPRGWGRGESPSLPNHYLSCFLGRVLLQNLGLAAGEERGLEVQAGRKQEKVY